jgi:ABC-type transporter Mla subunit MlaD
MTDWQSLLDAMDAGLEAFPPVVVDAGALPANPDPVPPALRARAQQTLQRMAEAATALEHHRAEIGRELTALSAAATAAAANAPQTVPHFLDTRA